MIVNRLDKTFGPFGSSTGFFLMVGGIIMLYFSVFGVLIAVAGAFAAFTSTSTSIDAEKKKIRYCDNLFGIFPAGKWIDIEPGMKLGLERHHRGFVGYTRGNQPVDIHFNDIRIILYDSFNKGILPVKKSGSYKIAQDDIQNLSILLGLQII